MSDLNQQTEAILKSNPDRATALGEVLKLVLTHFQSESGTIHRLDSEKQLLHLEAQAGLPPAVQEIVRTIPVGKGIAGQTVAQNGPVTICNLQTDKSGVARPGAKQTGVGSAVCVPIRNGSTIVGTLGIGTVRECEYTAEQTQTLESVGRVLGGYFFQA